MSTTATKRCTKCGVDKPLDEMGTTKGKPGSWCKQCNRESAKQWRQSNPEKKRLQNARRTRDPQQVAAYRRRYQQSEAGKASARRMHLRRAYGMTQADFDRMVEAQDGRCAICQSEARLVVDHDHSTGEVRALLCDPCNRGLGAFRDDPAALARAAEYVSGVWREV